MLLLLLILILICMNKNIKEYYNSDTTCTESNKCFTVNELRSVLDYTMDKLNKESVNFLKLSKINDARKTVEKTKEKMIYTWKIDVEFFENANNFNIIVKETIGSDLINVKREIIDYKIQNIDNKKKAYPAVTGEYSELPQNVYDITDIATRETIKLTKETINEIRQSIS